MKNKLLKYCVILLFTVTQVMANQTKVITLDVIQCIVESGKILQLCEALSCDAINKLKLVCPVCRIHEFTPATLAGSLASMGNMQKIHDLEGLLVENNHNKIIDFLMTTVNENKLICPVCEKFVPLIHERLGRN